MLAISYTLTPQLTQQLEAITLLWQKHCLVPIAPKIERLLRFQATQLHVLLIADLLGIALTDKEKEKFFSTQTLSPAKQLLANYRQLLTTIEDETAGGQPVTDTVLQSWSTTLYAKTNRPSPLTDISISEVKQLCTYVASEHPVIAAGLTYAQWTIWEPYAPLSLLGLLHATFYLTQQGYTARGQLVLPSIFSYRSTLAYVQKDDQHPDSYSTTAGTTAKEVLASLTASQASNWWLVFFAEAIHQQYQEIHKQLDHAKQTDTKPAKHTAKLSPRQRAILDLLDRPDASINNRFVQKKFRISQITASRELAALVAMGYLLQHGRSRSIHYTKI